MDDPRAEPQYGERVPYVVKAGAPSSRLIDRVVSPEEILKDKYFALYTITDRIRDMRLDAEYYITKTLIPPLERIFNLVGANVRNWYEDMPKIYGRNQKELHNIRDLSRRSNTTTLHSFMRSRLCTVCKVEETDEGIAVSELVVDCLDLCHSCREDPTESAYILAGRSQISERRHLQLQAICSDCCSIPFGEEVSCNSRDCPLFYSRLKAASQLENSVTKDSQLLAAIQDASEIRQLQDDSILS
jgi:DNA polymerase zeta